MFGTLGEGVNDAGPAGNEHGEATNTAPGPHRSVQSGRRASDGPRRHISDFVTRAHDHCLGLTVKGTRAGVWARILRLSWELHTPFPMLRPLGFGRMVGCPTPRLGALQPVIC